MLDEFIIPCIVIYLRILGVYIQYSPLVSLYILISVLIQIFIFYILKRTMCVGVDAKLLLDFEYLLVAAINFHPFYVALI